MTEYIIQWDSGYGKTYDCIEADNEQAAQEIAYDSWKEEAESNADYSVIGEATEELKEEYL